MEEPVQSSWQDDALGYLAMITCIFAFGGILLFGYQCLRWLIDGFWTPYTIGATLGISADGVEWQGLKLIAQWILHQSFALGLILIPFTAFCSIMMIVDRANESYKNRSN